MISDREFGLLIVEVEEELGVEITARQLHFIRCYFPREDRGKLKESVKRMVQWRNSLGGQFKGFKENKT